MIRVEFQSVGSGLCCWCQKEKKEVFVVHFGDFSGPMCLNDIRCAIRLKLAKPNGASTEIPGLPAKENL